MNDLALRQEPPSLLGEQAIEIPVGGTIRSGIMVPTREAAKNVALVEAYQTGVDAGDSFKSLNDRLKKDFNLQKNPLTPRNAPYFSVRPDDFAMPEIAGRILDLYGEDRGEGQHLYRFPVVFPVDQRLSVIPHQFAAYTASERRYWSEYGADGTRYCMMKAPVERDPRARRAPKVWGGRASILRPDNGGTCEPNKCAEYQSGMCALTGRFVFYVPGIPGVKAIQLKTRSIYSLRAALEQLSLVGFIRGGRISGLHDGQPLFWITKREEEVSMLDQDGKPKRVKQYLIALESSIDMTAMMSSAPQLEQRASEAVASLEGSQAALPEPDAPIATELATEQPAAPPVEAKAAVAESLKTAREHFSAALKSRDIKREDWRAYAAEKEEHDWWSNETRLNTLTDQLDNSDDLVAAVANFTVPF